ncbi:hypothetical protein BC939DRAFT_528994 [Gamsiella multidivaricata]|uniref:uncharacterized protein n=1 Tax=Gamsiella multidivaricata TaxID=101098 RepID=UPI00221EF0C1|nr:uncharacterized protein BC939DRAFT_528994 [Gamsiella multidivaricata]KAI7823316.1 hypothetical protein BC939DRAFT_528994 [Gamsiella multidivaricata]
MKVIPTGFSQATVSSHRLFHILVLPNSSILLTNFVTMIVAIHLVVVNSCFQVSMSLVGTKPRYNSLTSQSASLSGASPSATCSVHSPPPAVSTASAAQDAPSAADTSTGRKSGVKKLALGLSEAPSKQVKACPSYASGVQAAGVQHPALFIGPNGRLTPDRPGITEQLVSSLVTELRPGHIVHDLNRSRTLQQQPRTSTSKKHPVEDRLKTRRHIQAKTIARSIYDDFLGVLSDCATDKELSRYTPEHHPGGAGGGGPDRGSASISRDRPSSS